MIRTIPMMASALCVGLFTSIAGASPVLDSANFNTGQFAAGDLNNQNGWTVLQGTALVQNTTTNEGDQAVSLSSGTVIDKPLTATGQAVVWTESYFRGTGTTATPDYPTGAGNEASAIVHFSSNPGEGIRLLDGDGAGTGTFINAPGFSAIVDTQWYRITIRQNYTAHTWDCWVNGTLVGQDLGFRDTVNELHGFRQYAGVPSFLDTFLVRRRSNGDLDGDGDTDSSDVVLNVNAENAAPTDLFAFDDADFDANGTIEDADTTATVDIILNN